VAVEFTFLNSAEALDSFIEQWRNGTLPGPEFTHAAHVAACAWLTFEYRGEELAGAMKAELIRFNAAVGTPNSPDRGYHETLTRFWCVLVEVAVTGEKTRLDAARRAVAVYGDDRKASDRYYSFDVLKSRLARQEWIEPDVRPLPTTRTP
jgi:hypothetical protein